jgi:hypothetical protein
MYNYAASSASASAFTAHISLYSARRQRHAGWVGRDAVAAWAAWLGGSPQVQCSESGSARRWFRVRQ